MDEINRIDIEVLSVIATYLFKIRNVLRKNIQSFVLKDISISIKSGFGFFVTMNPGYVGRVELPENLKLMFRPVCMMTPEYEKIAQTMLFAEGFQLAKSLSVKIIKLYKLASEQLS